MALTIQKTSEHTFSGRFRDMRVSAYVADQGSGAQSGKLYVQMHDRAPNGFAHEVCIDDLSAADLTAIQTAIDAAPKKQKVKAGLKAVFQIMLAQKGATGTPEPEDDPAPQP